jgi:hypothetical protein
MDGFKETHERVVLLLEVDVETFQVFEGWLSKLKLSEFKELDLLFDCESPVRGPGLAIALQVLLSHGLSSGVVGSKTASSGSSLQTGQESSRTTFTHTSYIRKYPARFTSATIMDRLGYTIHNT